MPDYTILLIDYDPDSAELLRFPLECAGYRVELAGDGLSGIAKFHAIHPDLTLIEAMLPKKHGFEVCQELKQTPHGQRSGVWILTSVYKGRKYRTQAFLHYQCDEYLEKPIGGDELVASVNGFFMERARQAEIAQGRDDEAEATVTDFDPKRSLGVAEVEATNDDDAPPPAMPELPPAREGTYGGSLHSAAVPEMSDPEPAQEPLASKVPEDSEDSSGPEVPRESKRGRVLLWIALALLATLGGLLVITVLL